MNRLVLGGGSNQIELLKRSKENGDYVILVDYLDDCPGRKYADLHLKISTFDVEAVTEACMTYQVDSIVTAGTDQPVYTAAVASKATNIDFFLSKEVAYNVTNKRAMKDIFTKNNILCTDFLFLKKDFEDAELKGLSFPLVMKPVDTQGQRGIYLVESICDIRKHIANSLSYSREDFVMVEEYYDNDEITVNGWVEDGNLTILSVVDRVTISESNHIGVCLCHNHPSLHLSDYSDEIDTITEKIVKAFNIENGPIYFQYLVGSKGILVNEIACRIGGAYEGVTIPYLTGFDIVKAVLDYPKLSKVEIDKESYKKTQKYLSTQLFFCNPGLVNEISGQNFFKEDSNVLEFDIFYKVGDVIPRLENATARAGYFLVKGNSYQDMVSNIDRSFQHLKLLSDKNLVKSYQSYQNKYKYIKE